jgi:ABC-type transport system involved in multi-copper enzyme maturation permease subunit
VAFVIMLLVFIVGSIAYVYQYKASKENYRLFVSKFSEECQSDAANLTRLAVNKRSYILEPLSNSFIDDAKSGDIPNTITYNAYNVYDYSISQQSGNPYISQSNGLSWAFIISIIGSFTVLLLSYNSISGEREMNTLKLMISNPVSRYIIITGKFLSIIITGLLLVLPGFIASIVIFIISGIMQFNVVLLFEIIGFVIAQMLFFACMAALGLLCSTITRSANVSLLACLVLWSFFLILSPNIAVFAADSVFKVKDSETVLSEVNAGQDAINKSAPEGSWAMNSGNPFFPNHELRANNITKLVHAEKTIRDNWYSAQFNQYEKASMLTYISPISLFGMLGECITGSGYIRFQKNWNDFHNYQGQLLQYFKAKDSTDPKSPHWYNPSEDVSTTKMKVDFSEIPMYAEKKMALSERVAKAATSSALLICYAFGLFALTLALFNRYDVR